MPQRGRRPLVEVVVEPREFGRAGPRQQARLRELAVRLRVNPYLGNRIASRLVPQRFRALSPMFRLELPDGWRALYTVTSSVHGPERVWVVWIGDHTAYDRLFGY